MDRRAMLLAGAGIPVLALLPASPTRAETPEMRSTEDWAQRVDDYKQELFIAPTESLMAQLASDTTEVELALSRTGYGSGRAMLRSTAAQLYLIMGLWASGRGVEPKIYYRSARDHARASGVRGLPQEIDARILSRAAFDGVSHRHIISDSWGVIRECKEPGPALMEAYGAQVHAHAEAEHGQPAILAAENMARVAWDDESYARALHYRHYVACRYQTFEAATNLYLEVAPLMAHLPVHSAGIEVEYATAEVRNQMVRHAASRAMTAVRSMKHRSEVLKTEVRTFLSRATKIDDENLSALDLYANAA